MKELHFDFAGDADAVIRSIRFEQELSRGAALLSAAAAAGATAGAVADFPVANRVTPNTLLGIMSAWKDQPPVFSKAQSAAWLSVLENMQTVLMRYRDLEKSTAQYHPLYRPLSAALFDRMLRIRALAQQEGLLTLSGQGVSQDGEPLESLLSILYVWTDAVYIQFDFLNDGELHHCAAQLVECPVEPGPELLRQISDDLRTATDDDLRRVFRAVAKLSKEDIGALVSLQQLDCVKSRSGVFAGSRFVLSGLRVDLLRMLSPDDAARTLQSAVISVLPAAGASGHRTFYLSLSQPLRLFPGDPLLTYILTKSLPISSSSSTPALETQQQQQQQHGMADKVASLAVALSEQKFPFLEAVLAQKYALSGRIIPLSFLSEALVADRLRFKLVSSSMASGAGIAGPEPVLPALVGTPGSTGAAAGPLTPDHASTRYIELSYLPIWSLETDLGPVLSLVSNRVTYDALVASCFPFLATDGLSSIKRPRADVLSSLIELSLQPPDLLSLHFMVLWKERKHSDLLTVLLTLRTAPALSSTGTDLGSYRVANLRVLSSAGLELSDMARKLQTEIDAFSCTLRSLDLVQLILHLLDRVLVPPGLEPGE